MRLGTALKRKAQQIEGTGREKKQRSGQHMFDGENCRPKEGSEFHNVEIPYSLTLYNKYMFAFHKVLQPAQFWTVADRRGERVCRQALYRFQGRSVSVISVYAS